MKRKRNIKTKHSPKDRTIEAPAAINSDKETPAWQISRADLDGKWGLDAITDHWWDEIYPKLKNFESMTWAEIQTASGGRNRGNNNHFIQISSLCPNAISRLQEINQDDIEELFSLRLTGEKRIFGIKSGRVLKILWFDPKHEVCPASKR